MSVLKLALRGGEPPPPPVPRPALSPAAAPAAASPAVGLLPIGVGDEDVDVLRERRPPRITLRGDARSAATAAEAEDTRPERCTAVLTCIRVGESEGEGEAAVPLLCRG